MWAWSFRWLQFRGKGIVSKKKKKKGTWKKLERISLEKKIQTE
jgi:hypothetical protein